MHDFPRRAPHAYMAPLQGGERRVATVEAHHERTATCGTRVAQPLQLLPGETGRLLDKDRLAGTQPALSEYGMIGVPGCNNEQAGVGGQSVVCGARGAGSDLLDHRLSRNTP